MKFRSLFLAVCCTGLLASDRAEADLVLAIGGITGNSPNQLSLAAGQTAEITVTVSGDGATGISDYFLSFVIDPIPNGTDPFLEFLAPSMTDPPPYAMDPNYVFAGISDTAFADRIDADLFDAEGTALDTVVVGPDVKLISQFSVRLNANGASPEDVAGLTWDIGTTIEDDFTFFGVDASEVTVIGMTVTAVAVPEPAGPILLTLATAGLFVCGIRRRRRVVSAT